MPSYVFSCYGNITQWEACGRSLRFSSRRDEYLAFYVFRPSNDPSLPNCYSLVGTNTFQDVNNGDCVSLHVQQDSQVSVRPGDVVGFLSLSDSSSYNRIYADTNLLTVRIWYAHESTFTITNGVCPYQIARGGDLRSSIIAAPVITAVVGKCS